MKKSIIAVAVAGYCISLTAAAAPPADQHPVPPVDEPCGPTIQRCAPVPKPVERPPVEKPVDKPSEPK